MYEIVVDGQQHSGSYETEQQAKEGLRKALEARPDDFRGKKAEVRERNMTATGAADRYVTRDANGVPQAQVPLDAQGPIGSGPAVAENPNMLPGTGGAVQTEGSAAQQAKPAQSTAPKK